MTFAIENNSRKPSTDKEFIRPKAPQAKTGFHKKKEEARAQKLKIPSYSVIKVKFNDISTFQLLPIGCLFFFF